MEERSFGCRVRDPGASYRTGQAVFVTLLRGRCGCNQAGSEMSLDSRQPSCDLVGEMSTVDSTHPEFRHEALFYRGPPQYVNGVRAFLEEGLVRGEPTLVAVPGAKADLISRSIDISAAEVVDISELGRNPRRIIPAVVEFLRDSGNRRSRVICEMQWSARSPAEVAEVTRQEAFVNLALAEFPLTVLCPYELDTLLDKTLADARRTHLETLTDGALEHSETYEDPIAMCADELWPLDMPPGLPERVDFAFTELFALRRSVHDWASSSGLSPDRVDDLVLAVNELASNSIVHGGGGGTLSMWRGSDKSFVCEVRDSGQIRDPLVGSYSPGPDMEARGLWLVNHLCDLVEIRSGPGGTRVRVRVDL